MDIASYERREKMLKLREELLSVEEERVSGNAGFTVAAVADRMKRVIQEVNRGVAR